MKAKELLPQPCELRQSSVPVEKNLLQWLNNSLGCFQKSAILIVYDVKRLL